MLQRIQTVFILLAGVCLMLLFMDQMNLATIEGDTSQLQSAQESMLSDGVFDISDHLILIGFVLVGSLLLLIAIFLFKNRNLQAKLVRFTIVLSILFILLAVFLFYKDFQLMAAGTEVTIGYGILLPVGTLLFAFLANRYINKDEKLVRGSDRLR